MIELHVINSPLQEQMAQLHQILFNMHIMYSLALGIWAAYTAGRQESISGHYWGAVVTYALLAGATLLVGVCFAAIGVAASVRARRCLCALYAVARHHYAGLV